MKTITYQELTRDQRRKAIAIYHHLAAEKIYKQSDAGTLFTTTFTPSGDVQLVRLGEDSNAQADRPAKAGERP